MILSVLIPLPPEAHADNAAEERIRLAQQILDLYNEGKIHLSGGNKSKDIQGKQDNASARQNIIDTAAGNKANRSTYKDKGYKKPAPGGSVYLDVNMLRAIIDIEAKFGFIRISAISGSCHSPGSSHYDGIAFDADRIGGTKKSPKSPSKDKGQEIYDYLTSLGYDIKKSKSGVWENKWHYHVEVKGYKPVGYIRECQSDIPCSTKLVVSNSKAELFNQPCNEATAKKYNYESSSVKVLNQGDILEATAIIKNTEDNWWFRVKDRSGDGQDDYIWSRYVEPPSAVVQEYGSCVNLRAKNDNAVTMYAPVDHEYWLNNEAKVPNTDLQAVAVVQNVFGEYWYKLDIGRYIAGSQVDIVKTDWARAEKGISFSGYTFPSGVITKGKDIIFSGTAYSSSATISEISTEVLSGNVKKAGDTVTGSGKELSLQQNYNTAGYKSVPYSYSIKIKLSSYTASNIKKPETHEFVYKSGQFEIADDSFLSVTGAKPVCDIDLKVKFGSLVTRTPIADAETGNIVKNEYGVQEYTALKIVGNENDLWYQVIYDKGKTGYINSSYYRGHTVNGKPAINAKAESVSNGKATVSGSFIIPAWMKVNYVQIDSKNSCNMISNPDGSSFRKTLSETFSAGTHSLTARVYADYQFAKNGKLEKGSSESNACSFKVTVTSEQAPDATSAPTPDATSAPTPDATSAPTPDATSAPTPIVVSQTALEKEYLDSECTAYPAYLSLCAKNSTAYIKSLPCSQATNKNSNNVKRTEKGESLKAIGLYKNSAGNYWYRVILSDGRAGYIYAGDTVLASNYQYGDALTVSLSSIGSNPWGASKTVNGTVRRSAYLVEMSAVGYLFNPDGSQSSKSGAVVSSKESFSLKGTKIDSNLKFANLNQGQCTLRVTVTANSYYSPDGKQLEKKQLSTTKDLKFTVKPLSVSYDANGGSNAPGVQTVKYNKNLKLSSTTPKKENAEFLGWATSRGSNTVDYKPGTTIKNIKKDIRLYAVWKSAIVYAIDQAHFPDDNFRNYICSEFDTNGDAHLSEEEISAVLYMDCSYMSISSLKGIEYFIKLKSLECIGNQLTSLDLRKNTALDSLWCWDNQLTSLDVSYNTALYELRCSYNELTSLDVRSCTALTRLGCYNNQLTSLDVRSCTELTELWCSDNQLTSLDVSNCAALTVLDCGYNKISSLDLRSCTALTRLGCSGNQLTSLDVSSCTALTELSCTDNQLTSLDLSSCTALTYLSCYNNQLTSLDISSCTLLNELYCANNQLTNLDVRNCTVLTELSCYVNQLTSLDVRNCTELTGLGCDYNQLTSLDVRNCTELTELSCCDNQLTSLDVSNNPALEKLNCGWSKLSSLDVSNNPALEELKCELNQLTSLDVSSCTALAVLRCYSNQLTSLDLGHNTALTDLNCRYNELAVPTVSNRFDLSTLPGFDINRASNWEGGTLNGSVLTFSSDRVTYTYDLGNGNFDNPTFTLISEEMLGTQGESLPDVSAVAEELSESDFGPGSTVMLKGVFTVPEGEEDSYGWGFTVCCDGKPVNTYTESKIGEGNGKEIVLPMALVPGQTYTYQTCVMAEDETHAFSSVADSEPVSFTMPEEDGTVPEVEADQEFELGAGLTSLFKFTAADAGTVKITSSGEGSFSVYSKNGKLLGHVDPAAPIIPSFDIAKGDTLWISGGSHDSSHPMKLMISLQDITPASTEAEEPDEDLNTDEADADSEGNTTGEIPKESAADDPAEAIPPEQRPENQSEVGHEEGSSEGIPAEQPAEELTEEEHTEADNPEPLEAVSSEPAAEENDETEETEEEPEVMETEEETTPAEAPGEDAAAEPKSESSTPLPEE